MSAYLYNDQLETERLITRKLTMDDIATWAAFFDDEEAVELFPDTGLPTSEAKARLWIERQLGRYENCQYGLQALIEKDTQTFIGLCGLITQEVDGQKELETGYHIFKKYWGRGFAPEAARLFIDFAFTHNQAASVISIIDTRNGKSMRVAEKNGLIREKETRWNDLNIFVYRIRKEDWK
jgi:ribosomal-protein-alanine N-acetyltransferase